MEEKNKKKQKKNKAKKTLTFLLVGLFVMAFATAGIIQYYGSVNQNINVEQPIKVNGEEQTTFTYEVDSFGQEQVVGETLNVSNIGDQKRQVKINTTSPEGIDVSYKGTLELSSKDVNFSKDVWEVTDDNKAVVEYKIKDDEFSAEVVEGQETGYSLYYYSDNADRFEDVSKAVPVSDIGSESLPYETDENAEGGEYNYCETGEYNTCQGAKLWYLPNEAVDSEGNVDWSQADSFLFETKLIQFDSEGKLMVYPDTTTSITPIYDIGNLESGDYTVTTKILPA